MLLIEMQCKDWEHNRVNAGIIELSRRAFQNEPIKLYAEEKHISSLKDLIKKQIGTKEININSTIIDFEDWRFDNYNCSYKYESLLESIVEGEPEENTVVLLSCNKGIICAVENNAAKHRDKKFFIILHSALEEVVNEYRSTLVQRLKSLAHVILHKVNATFLSARTDNVFSTDVEENNTSIHNSVPELTEPSMKDCINACLSPNTLFVLYAPRYKNYLTGKIDKNVLDRFIFLHHPLYEPDNLYAPENEKLIIGIYGQAVNQNAYDIVKLYKDKYDNGKVEFIVMAPKDAPILGLKNVTRMFEEDYVSNEALEAARRKLDYILIPYDDEQYKVTASGILCDVLSEEIPVLMLGSPLLRYYKSIKNIGILCESKDRLACIIANLADERTAQKESAAQNRQAEHELKQIILQENIKVFREKIGL